jgi:hypothetical protein
MQFFWDRLAVCLHEILSEKLKCHPLACSTLYPYLRKVAVNTVENLKVFLYVYVHIHKHININACMYKCMYVCMYVHSYLNVIACCYL